MLILSRACGEWVFLDVPGCPNGCCPPRRLKVGVREARPKGVRLAFDCPSEVTVVRQEIARGEPQALRPGTPRP